MRQRLMKRWRLMGLAFGVVIAGWAAWHWLPGELNAETSAGPQAALQADGSVGRELFHRSWLPEDPRSPEGDGLGPMFNETSCAGCHNQGGPGGAGPTSKNVELLTAFVSQPQMRFNPPMSGPLPPGFQGSPFNQAVDRKAIAQELMKIHPGFEKSSSVVIHRFGTSSKHNQWRTDLLTPQPQTFQAVEASAFDGGTSLTFQAVEASAIDGGTFGAQATFQPAQNAVPTFAEPRPGAPEIGPPSSQPPLADSPGEFAPTTQPSQPTPVTPGSQPAPQRVPRGTAVPFQQVPQLATVSVGSVSTGIPLVDDALQEMRRLQQEARKDLSGSVSRGRVLLLRSQRSTSALFGAGVIDAIPDALIEAVAKEQHDDFPRVSGRIHRLPENKIGKFGWKAQKANLRDFTLAACANELGLDVPEHAQPAVPYEAHEKPKGHDMTEKQADALVAYVRSLPAPIEETPNDNQAVKLIEQGKELFESAGCAVCHKQDMGNAKGIYSDLLLHDMGDQLQASGSYGSIFVPEEFDPNPSDDPADTTSGESPLGSEGSGTTPGGSQDSITQPGPPVQSRKPPKGAAAGEWRTPPLWGIRDSAPYLHDGRAGTLEQAIALHGGEGSDAAIRFFMMPAKKQQRIVAFLKTLRAPEQHAAAK